MDDFDTNEFKKFLIEKSHDPRALTPAPIISQRQSSPVPPWRGSPAVARHPGHRALQSCRSMPAAHRPHRPGRARHRADPAVLRHLAPGPVHSPGYEQNYREAAQPTLTWSSSQALAYSQPHSDT